MLRLETLKHRERILGEAGFTDIEVEDCSPWYRRRVQAEGAAIESNLYPQMAELMGQKDADHFVENWRALEVVCMKGDLLQAYQRARKPA